MDVRELEPGRELDELIRAKFFETKYMCHIDGCFEENCCLENNIHDCSIAEDLDEIGLKKEDCSAWKMVEPEPFSTDISAAWEVVEKIKRKEIRGYGDIRIFWGNYGPNTTPKGPCGQMVYPDSLAWLCGIEMEDGRLFSVDSKTAPHAICLAALLAMEDKA